MTRLLAILLLLSAVTVNGATYTAVSPAQADVQAAVNSATADGDIVVIPAGSAAWPNGTTVDVHHGITIRGAGTNSTILSFVTPGNAGNMFQFFNPGYRITQIQCQGQRDNGPQQRFVVSAPVAYGRIDHMLFDGGSRPVFLSGTNCPVVVDHCGFNRYNVGAAVNGANGASWAYPASATIGTTNMPVFENCWFYQGQTGPSAGDAAIYLQEGARVTIRYCLFATDPSLDVGDSTILNDHGNQDYVGTFRGTVLDEFYQNTINIHHGYKVLYLRGGQQVHFSNVVTYASGSAPAVERLTEEESWYQPWFGTPGPPCGPGTPNHLQCVWPAQDQITNSYFWDITLNGVPITDVSLQNAADSTFIQQGRDYFMSAMPGYTPLAYPHPLIQSQSAPATPVNTTPANLAVNVSTGPTLFGSAYSSPESTAQAGSEWKILLGLATVWDSTLGAVTQATYPGTLLNSTVYTWTVRYQDSGGLWSAWSTPTSFTTAAAPLPTINFSAGTYPTSLTAGTVTLTVQRLYPSNLVSTVHYQTANGSAVAGTDYAATSGTLTFNLNTTFGNITVPIINTGAIGPARMFTVTLSSPTNGTLGTSTAQVSITQNGVVTVTATFRGGMTISGSLTNTSK